MAKNDFVKVNALISAALNNRIEEVKSLLQSGVDVNAVDLVCVLAELFLTESQTHMCYCVCG